MAMSVVADLESVTVDSVAYHIRFVEESTDPSAGQHIILAKDLSECTTTTGEPMHFYTRGMIRKLIRLNREKATWPERAGLQTG